MRAMRDSGVEWIGVVPASWQLNRIGQLYDLRCTKVSDRDFPPLSVTMRGILPQLQSVAKTDAHDDRKLVRKGDFVINSRSDRRGSCGIARQDGSVSLINTVLIPRDTMNPRYYDWLFHTTSFSDEFYRNGHGIVDDLWTTKWQEMKAIFIPEPTLDEQERIVEYLDKRCAAIDIDVDRRRKIIAKLSEYRKALITRVIAIGLNENTGMVQSGVDYIEEFPSHWKCLKFKHIAKVASNLVQPERYPDYQQVSPDCIEKDTGRLLKKQTVREAGVESNNHLYHGGMILYSKVRPLLNKATISVADGLCSADMYPIQTTQCVKWLLYYMLSDLFTRQVKAVSELRIKMPKVNSTELGEVWLLMPPKDEQEEIAMYLDTRTAEIDAIIAREEQLIDKLNEYKKSLIYHAVTGKIDCSEEVDNG